MELVEGSIMTPLSDEDMYSDMVLYTAVQSEGPAPEVGDINGDGVITIEDVTLLLDFIAFPGETDQTLYDVDGNGTVNVDDVTALLDVISAG